MIIGYDIIGSQIFPSHSAVKNVQYAEVKNVIADELHIQSTVGETTSDKNEWTYGTVLLATFNGDLEAGNIQMRENPIEKLRVKRRLLSKPNFIILKELPFNPEPTELIYDDYTALSDKEYEYVVVPVDATGIEGIMTATYVNPKFDGWWLIDLDNPEEYNFQFIYNLEDVSIDTDEDRTEMSTFGKYPIVRYGTKRAKRGQLSSLFIPGGYNIREQIERLDEMLAQHKPYLLKDGYGRKYIVDVTAPNETIMPRVAGLSKVTIDWVEVDEYND